MTLYCVVPECRNSSRTPGISLHRFPNDEIKKKAWCLRVRRHGAVTSAMRVCSAHFLPEDYRYVSDCRRLLKEGAEPSVFPYDTSQEAEAPLGFLLSMPKPKKVFEINQFLRFTHCGKFHNRVYSLLTHLSVHDLGLTQSEIHCCNHFFFWYVCTLSEYGILGHL